MPIAAFTPTRGANSVCYKQTHRAEQFIFERTKPARPKGIPDKFTQFSRIFIDKYTSAHRGNRGFVLICVRKAIKNGIFVSAVFWKY